MNIVEVDLNKIKPYIEQERIYIRKKQEKATKKNMLKMLNR